MSKNSNLASTPTSEQSNGGAPGEGQATKQVSSLPWASAATEPAHVPWNGGQKQASNGGSPFAVPAGPMPEDIPGFPFPDDIPDGPPAPDPPRVKSASARQVAPAIKPLSSLQRTGSAQSSAGQAQHTQSIPHLSQIASLSQASTNTFGRLTNSLFQTPGSGISTDQLQTGYLDPLEVMFHEPRNIQETGLNQGMIFDLVLKTMYYTSYMSGQDISAALRLPFYGIIDQIINLLKKEQLCEVSGASGLGEAGYQYLLTVKGMDRAHQVLLRSKYVGPAPVPLSRYIDVIKLQTTKKPLLNRHTVENALQGFVVSEELTNQVGAAVNAGKSLFLFGAPGNGKTLLTERIARMLGGHIIIPYSLEADGQIIQLFDLNSHRAAVPPGTNEADTAKAELTDRRWLKIQKPVVVAGGELTMASLDLIFNESVGFYEAPFQLKANGGLFLIDDFGRQQVSPQALLNRWIVPLEKSVDYLTLKTGKKLQVPFELFLVLSTNLQPEDLIDEAFLRRIQNKLFVPDPTPQQFYEIFLGQCRTINVPFNQGGFTHLVNKHYLEVKRPFRASQPRDLLRQLLGIARYRNVPPEMTPELLDAACATYFVNVKPKK